MPAQHFACLSDGRPLQSASVKVPVGCAAQTSAGSGVDLAAEFSKNWIVPMLRWITILWPGLPQLWLRGQWSALVLAIGFSALVNLVLLATWGWTELLEPPFLLAAWGGVVLFWLVSLVGGAAQMRRLSGVSSIDPAGDLFRAAQGEYLKGNWFEAELALNQLLQSNPGDVDAKLMLATLLRRIGQPHEARQQLQRLATIEGAGKWRLEIARQQRSLDAAMEDTAQNVQLHETVNTELPSAACCPTT